VGTVGVVFTYDPGGSWLFSGQINLRRQDNRFREQARSHSYSVILVGASLLAKKAPPMLFGD
jgi:hypothetical protein